MGRGGGCVLGKENGKYIGLGRDGKGVGEIDIGVGREGKVESLMEGERGIAMSGVDAEEGEWPEVRRKEALGLSE